MAANSALAASFDVDSGKTSLVGAESADHEGWSSVGGDTEMFAAKLGVLGA